MGAISIVSRRLPPSAVGALRRHMTPRDDGIASGNNDACWPRTFAFHQFEESCGVRGVQANAAMRGRSAEPIDLIAAMDCISPVEKDRMRHGRIVIQLGKP